MNHFIFATILLLFTHVKVNAQNDFITRNGKISFFSKTKLEDIRAVNNQVFSSLNTQTGTMQFLVLIKGFQFKNASMQQHFNDVEYMNSTVYPKSEFKGTITNLSAINFKKDGNYTTTVSGKLTMHGVTKDVQASGTITIKGGSISSRAVFKVKLADHDIKVPTIVTSKVAEEIEITVECKYEPFTR